jgi:hypothetical protein
MYSGTLILKSSQGVFILLTTSENVSLFFMDRDTMDAMDRMDTNGHVFMDRMDTCSR